MYIDRVIAAASRPCFCHGKLYIIFADSITISYSNIKNLGLADEREGAPEAYEGDF